MAAPLVASICQAMEQERTTMRRALIPNVTGQDDDYLAELLLSKR